MTTRLRFSLPVLAVASAVGALALAGCGSASASSPAASDDGTLTVVTSTNVYAQIAQEVLGDAATITPVIASAAQDPHEYEATAADQVTVKGADLLIINGGGYDPFMDTLIDASGSEAPVLVGAEYSDSWPDGAVDETATDELQESPHSEEVHDHDHIEGFNEHVWYDQHTIGKVAAAIAQEASALEPDKASTFDANLQTFTSQLEDLESSLADISSAHKGAEVMYTEPVPGYMVAAAGLTNVMPADFSEAVEQGQDVPPATLLEATKLLQSGTVAALIANSQAGGAETTQLIDTANGAKVPVLEFSETLPDGQTYIQWMQKNIADLAGALGS